MGHTWIQQDGKALNLAWPPRSPDLTSLDFLFWGRLRNIDYDPRPEYLFELKCAIDGAIKNNQPEQCRAACHIALNVFRNALSFIVHLSSEIKYKICQYENIRFLFIDIFLRLMKHLV